VVAILLISLRPYVRMLCIYVFVYLFIYLFAG